MIITAKKQEANRQIAELLVQINALLKQAQQIAIENEVYFDFHQRTFYGVSGIIFDEDYGEEREVYSGWDPSQVC